MLSKLTVNVALFFTAITAIGGCARKPIPSDELVISISADPATLDPRFATDAYGQRIVHLIFNSLVYIGPHLEIAPDAARTWQYKNLKYTLELAPRLVFHNGRPVTPEDLMFSYEQFSAKSSPFGSSFDAVQKFEAMTDGDHIRVVITLKHFVANFLGADLTVLKILPKEEIGLFPHQLIGSGSYRYVGRSDTDITLAAVPMHPILTAKMPKIIFKVVRDDLTRYQKLLKGEIDMVVSELAADKVKKFEELNKEFNVYRFPSASMNYILFNMRDPVLSNRAIRQALSQAINRSEFIKYKMEGLGIEATSLLPPNHPDFNAHLKNADYDLEAAKQVVKSLGLVGHKIIFKTSNNPGSIDNGRVLAYELSQTGLDVELESYQWGKFYADIKKGNFQVTMMKWVPVLDASLYREAFHSTETPPGRNRGFYKNPELDALMDKASATENETERRRLYQRVQKLVFDDLAILPMWYDMHFAILHKNIQGFEPSQAGSYEPLLKVWKLDASLALRSAGTNDP